MKFAGREEKPASVFQAKNKTKNYRLQGISALESGVVLFKPTVDGWSIVVDPFCAGGTDQSDGPSVRAMDPQPSFKKKKE